MNSTADDKRASDGDLGPSVFLATLVHELREPMNGVLGMARLLRDTPLDEEQRGYVDLVIDSGETLITLINDVMDFSRIDAGKLDFVAVDFALRPFLDRLGQLLGTRARQKGLDFSLEVDAALPAMVHADPGRLRQVIVNIAGNAIKFTEQGGVRIKVQGAPAAEGRVGLAIEIADSGPGIPENQLATLFSSFSQGNSGTPRLYGGSGLGLLIAERLVRCMNGSIAVASRPGEGATFTTMLELEPAEGRQPGAATERGSLAGATALVVDAQARTRQVEVELCRLWGMEVRSATTAAQALSVLREAADRKAVFDIVIIDRELPDMSGDELGAAIRAEPALAHAGLVLLVASGLRGDAARARDAGFDAYLPKPVTASTLLDCLQQLRGGSDGLITIHSMSEARSGPLSVLVADDNEVNRKLVSIMLERAGHDVTLVADGAEAVAALEQRPFDLVLMDVQMPVMDGLAATRAIRKLDDRSRSSVPVVAITANAMPGDDNACISAGMDGYVSKPVTRAGLLAAVERHARMTGHGDVAKPTDRAVS